jgi:hypothetical protein
MASAKAPAEKSTAASASAFFLTAFGGEGEEEGDGVDQKVRASSHGNIFARRRQLFFLFSPVLGGSVHWLRLRLRGRGAFGCSLNGGGSACFAALKEEGDSNAWRSRDRLRERIR